MSTTTAQPAIGFIGLGDQGLPMADDSLSGTWRNGKAIVGRYFGTNALRVDSARGPVDHHLMNAVFDERRTALGSPQTPGIGFVFSKEQLWHSFTGQPVVTQVVMLRTHKTDSWPWFSLDSGQHRSVVIIAPGPGVAVPGGGKQMERCPLWSANRMPLQQ